MPLNNKNWAKLVHKVGPADIATFLGERGKQAGASGGMSPREEAKVKAQQLHHVSRLLRDDDEQSLRLLEAYFDKKDQEENGGIMEISSCTDGGNSQEASNLNPVDRGDVFAGTPSTSKKFRSGDGVGTGGGGGGGVPPHPLHRQAEDQQLGKKAKRRRDRKELEVDAQQKQQTGSPSGGGVGTAATTCVVTSELRLHSSRCMEHHQEQTTMPYGDGGQQPAAAHDRNNCRAVMVVDSAMSQPSLPKSSTTAGCSSRSSQPMRYRRELYDMREEEALLLSSSSTAVARNAAAGDTGGGGGGACSRGAQLASMQQRSGDAAENAAAVARVGKMAATPAREFRVRHRRDENRMSVGSTKKPSAGGSSGGCLLSSRMGCGDDADDEADGSPSGGGGVMELDVDAAYTQLQQCRRSCVVAAGSRGPVKCASASMGGVDDILKHLNNVRELRKKKRDNESQLKQQQRAGGGGGGSRDCCNINDTTPAAIRARHNKRHGTDRMNSEKLSASGWNRDRDHGGNGDGWVSTSQVQGHAATVVAPPPPPDVLQPGTRPTAASVQLVVFDAPPTELFYALSPPPSTNDPVGAPGGKDSDDCGSDDDVAADREVSLHRDNQQYRDPASFYDPRRSAKRAEASRIHRGQEGPSLAAASAYVERQAHSPRQLSSSPRRSTQNDRQYKMMATPSCVW